MTIDTQKSILKANEYVIFVLRFGFINQISVAKFCELAQKILYDELGSTGNFRIAPKERQYLNANFIEFCGEEADYNQYYDRDNNEIISAFILRYSDPDVTLNDELIAFSKELSDFCDATDSTFEQLDINSMY